MSKAAFNADDFITLFYFYVQIINYGDCSQDYEQDKSKDFQSLSSSDTSMSMMTRPHRKRRIKLSVERSNGSEQGLQNLIQLANQASALAGSETDGDASSDDVLSVELKPLQKCRKLDTEMALDFSFTKKEVHDAQNDDEYENDTVIDLSTRKRTISSHDVNDNRFGFPTDLTKQTSPPETAIPLNLTSSKHLNPVIKKEEVSKPGESCKPKSQILLLNGKEFEIVPLGDQRWISRNEYELLQGLDPPSNQEEASFSGAHQSSSFTIDEVSSSIDVSSAQQKTALNPRVDPRVVGHNHRCQTNSQAGLAETDQPSESNETISFDENRDVDFHLLASS